MPIAMAAPVLRPFCTLEVEVGPVQALGAGRLGERRIIPIAGGRVSGPRLSGRIIPGGADWQTVSRDGLGIIDARYAIETEDGAVLDYIEQGFRHGPPDVMKQLAAGEPVAPEAYYMRASARLETGHEAYSWVNRMIFVATGARQARGVQIDLYSVE
jgi:hypothetical protein